MENARSTAVCVAAALFVAAAIGALLGTPGARGAATSSTITAEVTSAVSITNACSDPRGYRLGNVAPGDPAITATDAATCGIEFSSSNDSAMLRAYQADQAGTAMSASPLTWQRRNAGLGNLNGVSFVPGTSTGWAVGDNGLVLKTTDGGATWAQQTCTPCGSSTLRDVTAPTATVAFVAGTSGRVYRFDGTAWAELTTTSPAPDFQMIDATDANTVWAIGGSSVFRSTNASAATVAWSSFAPVGTTSLFGLDAVDSSVAFVSGNSGTVARTVDGGANWQVNTSLTGSLRSVAAESSTSAVLVTAGGVAHTTTDGLAWTARWTGVKELLHDVARSGSTVYAVSEVGRVVKSADGGTTWTMAERAPTVGGILDLGLVDASTVVGVGNGKIALRSTDGATSWSWRYSGGGNLGSVAAISATAAYAVGDQGSIARTADGGTTWPAQTSPTSRTLRAVDTAGSSGNRAVAVGDDGTIVTTSDGGATWTARNSGTTARLLAVELVDQSVAWAAGEGGIILRSTNAGVTWSAQSSGTAAELVSIAAASPKTAWVAGGTGAGSGTRLILGTADGGSTWNAQHSGTGSALTSISASSSTSVTASTLNGNIFRSTDGATWTSAALTSRRLYSITAVGPVVFVAGVDAMFRSADSGATWEPVTGFSFESVVGVDAVDPSNVIGVGAEGVTVGPTAVGAGSTISDYGAAPNSWGGDASASLFAVCLQTVGTGTTAVWTPDNAGVVGTCEISDADPWRALPTAPSKVASVATAGTTGRANFVFGMRPATGQDLGNYYATVAFEAIAPNA